MGVGTWGDLTRNLVYTVPGNLVGGGLFVGLAYGWLGSPTSPRAARLSRPTSPVPWTEDDLEDDVEAELVAPAAATSAAGRHQARPEAPQGHGDQPAAKASAGTPRRVAASASRTNGRSR